MVGLVSTENAVSGTMPVSRWVAVFILVGLIHCAPMFFVTFAAAPDVPDDGPAISVSFSDYFGETPESATTETLAAPPAPDASRQVPPPAAATRDTPVPPVAPAPASPAAVPVAPPPLSTAVEPGAERKLVEPDLPPLAPKPMAAFDESKATKEAPKDGYLSDRNSTAADRGPKNLPRGDPFIDDGQSKDIRYLQQRGEGNLPAVAAGDTSGSVKKEGNPDAGKGPELDPRPPDRKQPPRSVLPSPPDEKKMAEQAAKAKTLAGGTFNPAPDTKAQPITARTVAGDDPGPRAKKSIAEPPKAVAEQSAPTLSPSPANAASGIVAAAPVGGTPSPAPRAKTVDELEAFKALLEGRGTTDGRGGETGGKVGVHARPGAKGHEGDGTLRPGHDEAVSDVTTINLESSAEGFDEARFAKRFDARTAYVKPLARRIDNKWKAERVARNRLRFAPGVVTFRIVLRKDGELLEATEVSRTPKELPDEYSASAKVAIQRAADPLSEPFPAELAKHETLEFAFNFLY